jgi:hypothetical protein
MGIADTRQLYTFVLGFSVLVTIPDGEQIRRVVLFCQEFSSSRAAAGKLGRFQKEIFPEIPNFVAGCVHVIVPFKRV